MRERAPGAAAGPVPPVDDLEDERTESVPMATPRYANERWQELGEHIAALYASRDRAVDEAERGKLNGEIAIARGRMRKGTRLHAGEFLQDGRYRLLDRLGHDTHAERWQAWDRHAGELVALEVMHAEWVDDDELVDAFVAATHALQRIEHPGVARVADAARSEEGFVYVASRFCGVTDLESAVLGDKVAEVDALQVTLELVDALAAVHEAAAVHGGLSPATVILSDDGAAHLTGFRLGPTNGRGSLYAAPETLERGHAAAPSDDVYALGMTAAFALHRRELPFWVLRDAGRFIDELPTSDTVKAVLRRATAWSPEERYPKVAALREELLRDAVLVEGLAERAWSRARYPVAAAHYEQLLRLRPADSVPLRTRLGEVYLRMEAHEQAFEHLALATEQAMAPGSVIEAEAAMAPRLELLRHQAAVTGDWMRLARALWNLARKLHGPRRAVVRSELARINQEELADPTAAAENWSQVLGDHHTPELARRSLEALSVLAEERADWAEFVVRQEALLPYLPPERRPEVQLAIARACLEHLGDEDAGLRWIDRAEAGGLRSLDLAEREHEIRARRGEWPRVIELMQRQAEAQETEQVSRTLLRAGLIARSVHHEALAVEVYEQLLQRIPGHVVALRELARMHYRSHDRGAALRYFEALTESFVGRKAEEPESSERAADLLAFARLLLREGRREEAVARLGQALKLSPDLVPALKLAGPLQLVRGDTESAGRTFDRLHALYRSLDEDDVRLVACVGLGDVAWIQGKLAMALGWYNRALEADPLSAAAWWGLARTSLASRGGHPGADRAPWLGVVPRRFTPPEALARLLAGCLDADAMRSWLGASPMGAALLSGGDAPIRVALSVVDVLLQHGLVDPTFFERLAAARPEWGGAIEQVQAFWFGSGELDSVRAARWSAPLIQTDFATTDARPGLPWPSSMAVDPDAALAEDSAWATLFGGESPVAPSVTSDADADADAAAEVEGPPIGALLREGRVFVALRREAQGVVIGAGADADARIQVHGIAPVHVRLSRVGDRIYLRSEPGLTINGEPAERRRLQGGEALSLGGVDLAFVTVERESELPEPWATHDDALEAPEPGAGEASVEERAEAEGAEEGVAHEGAPLDEQETAPAEEAAAEPADPESGEEVDSENEEEPAAEESAPEEAPEAAEADAEDPEAADVQAPEAAEPQAPEAAELSEADEPEQEGIPSGFEDPLQPGEEDEPTTRIKGFVAALREDPEAGDDPDDDPALAEESAEPAAAGEEADTADSDPFAPGRAEPTVELPGLGGLMSGSGSEPEAEEGSSEEPAAEADAQQEEPAGEAEASEDDSAYADEDDEPDEDNNITMIFAVPKGAQAAAEAKAAAREAARRGAKSHTPTPNPAARHADLIRKAMEGAALAYGPPQPVTDDPSEEVPRPEVEAPVPQAITAGVDESQITEGEPPVREEAPFADVEPAPRPYDPPVPRRTDTSEQVTVITAPPLPSATNTIVPGFDPDEAAHSDDQAPADDQAPGRDGVAEEAAPEPQAEEAAPESQAEEVASELRAEEPAPSEELPAPEPEEEQDVSPPPRRLRAVVEVMSGPARGTSAEIEEVLRIGSGPDNELAIAGDTRLDGHHCSVVRTDVGFQLRDAGSGTGTVMNGTRVDQTDLAGGEVIMVGRTVLRFRCLDE